MNIYDIISKAYDLLDITYWTSDRFQVEQKEYCNYSIVLNMKKQEKNRER